MAWTDIGNGPGIWNGLSISEPAGSSTPDLKTIMRDLVLAVFEKDAAVRGHYTGTGESTLTFVGGNGVTFNAASFSGISDFDGMSVRGEGSGYRAFLGQMRSRITTLVESTTSAWSPDATTRDELLNNVNDLLALGTFGSSWIDTDTEITATVHALHQMREALDNLIYPIYAVYLDTSEYTGLSSIRFKASDGSGTTNWGEVVDADWTYNDGVDDLYEAEINARNSATSARYTETITVSPGPILRNSTMQGTLLEGIYVTVISNGLQGEGLPAFTASNSKASVDLVDYGIGANYVQFSQGTGWPTIGSDTPSDRAITSGVPDTPQFRDDTKNWNVAFRMGRCLNPTQNASAINTPAKLAQFSRAYCKL